MNNIRICLKCGEPTKHDVCQYCCSEGGRLMLNNNSQPAYHPTMSLEQLNQSIARWERWPSLKLSESVVSRRKEAKDKLTRAEDD